MSRIIIFKTLVLLAVTTLVRSQYIDFFQGFSSFLQPYQTTRRAEVVTKRSPNRQTNKQRYQDAIFFESDEFIKQKQNGRTANPFIPTTVKPKRAKTLTTKSPWFQDFPNTPSNERNNGRTIKNQANVYDIQNNNRKVDRNNVYNNDYNNYEVVNAKNYNTQNSRPSNFGVTQKPSDSRPVFNSHTTKNPLLHRPGVKPAPVDVNRPPITNRPVTSYTQKPVSSEEDEPNVDIGPDEDDMSEAERKRYIEIAEQKCDEYKALMTKKLVALPLAPSSHRVELNVTDCKPVHIPLIIGGRVVSIQEFPHMGLVGWKNLQSDGYSWKCGGTLISEQFVLTAGHCTYHDKDYNIISGPPHAVQLGSSLLNGRDSTVVTISRVVRHPKFKLRRSYYDVALIKLVSVVTFSASLRPACIGVPPPVGDMIIATGWGRTEFGGDSSQELRSVSVPIWDMGQCREVWGTSRKLPEGPSPTSQLCAGERSGGKDTCQGDSGGPAQIQDGCTWRVVAVTSVGRSCGAAETPALYAKIPRAFIASQVFSNVKFNKNNGYNDNSGNRNGNNGNSNGNNGNYNGNNGNRNDNNGDNNGNNGFGNGNRFNRDEENANNHANAGSNDSYNGNNGNDDWNNQSDDRDHAVNRPGNHQTIGNNNFGIQFPGNDRDVLNRPGNHQSIPDRGVVTINQFGNRNSDNREINRPGNHQTISYRETSTVSSISGSNVRRPGNHQFIGNDRSDMFVDSKSESDVNRPGNHQTISNVRQINNNGRSNVYSDQSSVIRPGNHQTLNNRETKFSDSQNSGSNQDVVFHRPGNHHRVDSTNNEYNDVRNNEHNDSTTTSSYYYNDNIQNRPQSNYGTEYTTESVAYNRNNGYNDNNEYTVIAVRPWWI